MSRRRRGEEERERERRRRGRRAPVAADADKVEAGDEAFPTRGGSSDGLVRACKQQRPQGAGERREQRAQGACAAGPRV